MNQQELFERNQGLAYTATRQFCRRFPRLLQDEDILLNYALMGLWEAARAFDPTLGPPFSCLAWEYMRNQLRLAHRELTDCGIPRHPRRKVRAGRSLVTAVTDWPWDLCVDTRSQHPEEAWNGFCARLPFLTKRQLELVYQVVVCGRRLVQLAEPERSGVCWRTVAEAVKALEMIEDRHPKFAYRDTFSHRDLSQAARAYVLEVMAKGPSLRDPLVKQVRKLFGIKWASKWLYQVFVRTGTLQAQSRRDPRTGVWNIYLHLAEPVPVGEPQAVPICDAAPVLP